MNITEFNYIESGLWFLMAAILLFMIVRQGRSSPCFVIMVTAFVGFFAFAISDIIEAKTGVWWRPLWLLVLKAACVVTLAGCYIQYKKVRRSAP